MLDHKSTFDVALCMDSPEDAVPSSLLQFVGMVEHGADIKSQLRFGASKTDTAITQLLQFTCYGRLKECVVTHRHSKDRDRRHFPTSHVFPLTWACRFLQGPRTGSL